MNAAMPHIREATDGTIKEESPQATQAIARQLAPQNGSGKFKRKGVTKKTIQRIPPFNIPDRLLEWPILQESQPSMQIKNQLFAIPASFTDRWKTEHEKLYPTTILTEDGSSVDISFHIPPCTHGLLSLNDVCLELEVAIKVQVRAANWQFISDVDGEALINNFLHSLFQNLTVELEGQTITDSYYNYYAYRAYMEIILSHSVDALATQMTASLYHTDTTASINDNTNNQGEIDRQVYGKRGEYVPLSGGMNADLVDLSKPLTTGIPLNIRLLISRSEFHLRVRDADNFLLTERDTLMATLFSDLISCEVEQDEILLLWSNRLI